MTQRVPASASVQDALAMARSAMSFVYAADAAAMAVDSQAGALRDLEVLDAIQTVARASYLNVFMSAQGHVGDADYGPRAWLMHKTGITRGAAAGHVGWARRVAVHPELGKALAAGEVPESYGRMIATWTDRLPEDCRPAADAILLGAARSGMDLTDLTGLAAGIHHRSMPGDQDPDHFGDRSVRVGATLDGAGVIRGDLTPQCAAVVTTVLDAVSAPADPGDTRSRAQRYHDGLQDAMERLVAAGLLPERAGVPVKVWAHICLADLMELAGASAVARQWVAGARAAWAAHRAAGPAGGGDGGVWLTGGAAAGAACDGSVAPVVPGAVNPGAFYHLVTLAAGLADLGYLPHRAVPGQPLTGSQPSGDGQPTSWGQPSGSGPDAGSRPAGAPAAPAGPAVPGPEVLRRWEALEQAIVAQAVQLLSGPGGLVSHVRRGMAGGRLGGPASRWTSGTARRSRPGSGTRSGSATSTAPGPADTSSKHTSRVDRCRLARPGLAARCHLSHLAAAELLLTMGHLNLLLSCIAVISNGVFDVHQT